MATEVQTQTRRCTTHGTVQATREIPKMGFPFIVYAFLRSRAKRKPYLCPECGEPVEAG
jgi:predicted RNA-binding Zn-ribbon protein involved in translation (DUF1610 family)